MDRDEKAGFASAAKLAGLPLAVWMRTRLREMATMEMQIAGKAVPWTEA
jgi:hypothetical protein